MSTYEERYKERKKKRQEQDSGNSYHSRYLARKIESGELDIEKVGKELSNRVNTWIENNKNYISSAQSRFSGDNSTYRSDASDWLTTVTTQRDNFQKEAESIKTALNYYKDFLEGDYINSVVEALDGNLKAQDSVITAATQDRDFWSQFDSEDTYNSWYKEYTAKQAIKSLEDFEEYSQKGASIENPSFREANGWLQIGNWRPFGEDIGNIVTFSRDNIDAIQKAMMLSDGNADLNSILGDYRYQYMDDDEVAIYNYYLGKGETDKAAEYLASLDDKLNQIWSGHIAQRVSGNPVSEIVFAAGAGLDQFVSGVKNLDNFFTGEEGDAPTVTQYASQQIRENLGGFMGGVYDLTQTTANMLPSILVGTLTGGVGGALTMGAGVVGNAYSEMRTLGYNEWQARGYALLSGVAESTLQYALGGISPLGSATGGVVSKAVTKALGQVDNAIARVAIELGANMLDEGLEEAVQSILEPIFKTILTGDNYDIDWGEVAYSALLGSLSAGLLEGVPTIAGTAINSSNAKKVYGEQTKGIVAKSLELDPDNAHAQRMQARLDNGKNVSGYQINRLLEANESALHAQDVSAIRESVTKRLTELGETGNISAISEALTKQAQGEKLTRAEKQIISNSKFGQRVANEFNPDNIQSGQYSSAWAEKVSADRTDAYQDYARTLAGIETKDNAQSTKNVTEDAVKSSVEQAKIATQSTTQSTTDQVEAENYAEATADNAGEAQTVHTSENATVKENAPESENLASDGVTNAESETVTLESASKAYGAQAGAMVSTYIEGQDVAKYDTAYRAAYDMGRSGVNLSYAMNSESTAYLTESQRENAHAAGVDASNTKAKAQDAENKAKANGKTGRRKGVVRGEGVSIADLKTRFNDKQGVAYKLLSTYAEATGIDIVLYNSVANDKGEFQGGQGKFKWSEDTIYIDINAGLGKINDVNRLAKYTMMRTFSHEFCHFIEKWNPIWYNEFRKVVFDTLTERGENVEVLITAKKKAGMDYDAASREVVAEAMTDILPDANFVEELATKHKNIFHKLLDMLKEFVADLKAYFNSIGHNPSREANALKEQVGDTVKYLDNIVKLFDKVAVEAVENYQATVATEIDTNNTDGGINNAEQRAEEANDERRTDSSDSENEDRARSQDENGRGVSEGIRGISIKDTGLRGRRGVSQSEEAFSEESFITPKDGSIEAIESKKVTNEYGIECYVVKKAAWVKKAQAFSRDGRVYIKEGIDEKYRGVVAPHEVTHVMKQRKFQPYLDFIERTPDMLDMTAKFTEFMMNHSADHRNIDIFDMSDSQRTDLYDEINATLYGHYSAGQIVGDFGESVTSAFHDFATYINELSSIHEQFKKENAPQKAVEKETATAQPTVEGKKTEKKKSVSTKKSDWSAHDVEWHIPGKKTPIAYSTVATSDLIEALADDNKTATIKELIEEINYDEDAKKVLQQYIDAGYGDQVANEWFNHNKQEANTNGENADNQRPVLGSDTDRQGASRLLDEVQAEDVRGVTSERDAVGDTRQRESQTGRDDNRAVAESGDSRSDGSGEVGDLRRDELTTEEAKAQTEKETEAAEREIEQKSTVEPKGRNFVIGDSLNLPDGEKARYRANVDAIRLIKQLETEGRYATEAEQEILSKYVGWGGIANAFGDYKYNRETRRSEMTAKDGWEKEFSELRSLIDEGVITEQEYSAMSKSTTNAHYTSIEVIKAMYDGLASLGFKGGRMLEPSSGVGNFVGAMPASMSANVNSWTMVELDRITGLIAKYLYPNADVRIQGFENANIPDNYMDVAIGNVPFGSFGVVDRAYPKRITKAIHNYFFAKSLDKVRPGGIVMFITSSFTMSSSDSAVRKYIMERADLLGAIRLPNTAFKGNAGTEVVTDILVLKKRESGTEYAGEDFLEAEYNYEHGAHESIYFKNHPEMVLGKPVTKRGMYGANTLTYEPYTDRGTIDEQIREAFKNIKGEMSYPEKLSREKTNFAVERANKKTKAGGFVVNSDGSISKNENGQLVKVDTDEKTAKRIAGMLSIRDAYRKLASYLQQGLVEVEIKRARKDLNAAYDKFVKEFGYLNSAANKRAIESDPDRYAILSLENYDAQKKTAKKTDIFTKDTISANKTVTHVDSVEEGVIASINLTGGVDTELIAKLTDKTAAEVTRDIIDSRLAFKTRDGGLVAREAYLSGNVRAKLREAESLAPYDADYNNNIEELRRVVPADITYNDIYITPGATFIPNEVYADFIAHMLGGRNTGYSGPDVEVGRTANGEFKIVVNNKRLKNNYYNRQTWGTARKSFLDLIDAMMGSRTVKVNDILENADGKKITVVNEAETEAANEKVKAIQKEFEEWIWKDEDRRNALAKLYNETFNALVNPKYDGSHLSVNGINPMYSLMAHQANAVHRVISSGGNTLLAHRVGAGKTLEMASAAMKMRELGVIKKPVFVVPKSVVAQWGVEFNNYFPAAKLLVSDEKSFTPANRRIFTNMIANGDYDAVIVTYEQFEKIPMSAEYQARFYEEQINEIIDAIAEEKAESRDGKGLTVKEMEKKKAQLEKKLKELTSKPKDEDNVDFEMLGIDSLFVDEAHNFKNLEYVSKMTNVAGLGSTKGAQRAFDLYTKIRYLQGLNGGRGIVFATATPVMNSMVELYIMQKYLQPDVLNQLGLKTFDAWAKQFGEVVNKWEINPSGTGMRQKQVFANFRNLNELQLLFRSFTDVVTELPYLKIPKMKGGAVKIVECEPGEFQRNYMQELQKRAENVKNVDPSEDNMLKITSDGRKVSYTQRMIDPTLPYEPDCKIFKASENILKEYKESADIKGTQIVFLDMATPKGTDKSKTETSEDTSVDTVYDEENAKLYDDMRNYLVKNGIPKREIAFIHEADSDAKRKQLFEDVNNGKVRVLIGSTGKMGVGMNAQKRVVAIHHLDAPWRPGDVEQRDGRAFRQKNINEEVSKYVYVTKGSFDSRLWDILDRKQHFINQIMNGEDVGRTAEDTGEVTLSAAEVKALASGNPLIEEQTKLTDQIKKLENLQKAYNSSMTLARTKLSDDITKIANYESSIERIREDISTRKDTYSEGKFSINIGGKQFTDNKEAGVALAAEITAKANKEAYVTVAKFAGFELRVIKDGMEYKGVIHGKENYKFNVYMNNTTRMVNHIGEVIAGFENIVKNYERLIAETTVDRDAQQNILKQPFEKQAELAEKRARFNEVMELLAPKTEEQLGKTADDTVQEQSREYLKPDEQEQQRTNTLTDREILQIAADNLEATDMTEAERDALRIFKDRLAKLENLQDERAEQGRLYKEQQFTAPVDRKAAEATLNRMAVLDEQIKKAEADVLSLEDKKVFGNVLKKAKKVVEGEQRKHDNEVFKRHLDRMKNAAAIKKYRERIQKDVGDLTSWITKPNNKDITKHVPDVIKNSVIPFLSSIDFTSKQQLRGGEATKADAEFAKRLSGLEAALKENIKAEGLYSGYTDLPPNFMEKLNSFIKTVDTLIKKNSGEFVINKMTSEELQELASIVANLKAYVTQMNKFLFNSMHAYVWEAGDNSIATLSEMASNDGKANAASNFVFWQQIRPAYAFERFGEGGKAIYDGLRRGQAQLAFNTQKIVEFTEKAYTDNEVKAWEKEIKTIKISAGEVKMRVSDMMSFYELSKQPDSLRHMLGEGMRVATYTQGGKKISDNGHALTEEDIKNIVSELTPRQKEVADALQKFMQEQGGAWGNYVSVARFGEEQFTNEQYFPINSDGRHLQSTADEYPSNASLYALLNMSFTKSRNELANNRIIVYSIFDVFANHMASMAQYNAMALPVLDAIKWFNYQQKTEDADGNKYVKDGVREQMDRVYGVPEETRPGKGKGGYAQSFVLNILKAFNGTEAQGVPTDTIGMNTLRRYNMAQIAYNFRVVIQQPLAITRAALLIDYRSIMRGTKLKPSAIKQNIEEMRKHSGIAAWKSLGFYDVNISRGLTDTIKHSSTVGQKIGDIGMKGAETADTLAWAAMWSACKEEVIRKQKLRPGDAGFFDAVTKLFEDVIYKTQVVDSVLTKNEFMRSKGLFARAIGSFMSEPVTSASMVVDAVDKFNADMKRGMSRSQAWEKHKRMIGRTMYVYGVSAVILAAVQAVADAARDDDDYETFIEKWLEAFGGNLIDEAMPFNKLPILSDFYDLAKELLSIFGVDTYGNPPQSIFMQWYDSLIKGVEILYNKISGEDTNYTYYGGIYKLLQAVSGMFGVPMASATREAVTAWNNIISFMAPSLKVKTYDPGEQNEIKYAYQDGYLTFDEAVSELLEQGLVDNEDEAYFTVSGWEAGEGYSRYDKLDTALRSGVGFDEAMAELTSHGYTEKDIYSRVSSKAREWYKNGEISRAQAESMLKKHTDKTDEEIEKALATIDFVKAHPEYEGISESAVAAYTEYCKSYGIAVDVFYDVWQFNDNATADVDRKGNTIPGSKKEKVLDYIHTLDLSRKQKDQLYYAFGWAKSTISDAPWR